MAENNILNKDEKNILFLEALKDLDLSPTMEKNVRDKYNALSSYLEGKGIKIDFYPQGSFLIGTVIKPFHKRKTKNYDLDVLVILGENKKDTSASDIKNIIGKYIQESKIYSEKLEKEDRNCWTLKYAEDSNGAEFSLDIVPAVDEEEGIKLEIICSGVKEKYILKTVAITDKNEQKYNWLTSNPLGFGEWFLEISDKHLSFDSMQEQFNKFSDEFKVLGLENAEEIPKYFYRSNLQRAVQVIKRHRDIYFDRSENHKDKPSSILLSALVADSIKDESNLGIIDIIDKFINDFLDEKISIMNNGKILNPVDKRENLIATYSENKKNNIKNWILKLRDFIRIEDLKVFKQNLHNYINDKISLEFSSQPNKVIETKPWKKERIDY